MSSLNLRRLITVKTLVISAVLATPVTAYALSNLGTNSSDSYKSTSASDVIGSSSDKGDNTENQNDLPSPTSSSELHVESKTVTKNGHTTSQTLVNGQPVAPQSQNSQSKQGADDNNSNVEIKIDNHSSGSDNTSTYSELNIQNESSSTVESYSESETNIE